MDSSNAINIATLIVTATVGILAWFGARKAAREALDSQNKTTEAEMRINETALDLQRRLVEIDNSDAFKLESVLRQTFQRRRLNGLGILPPAFVKLLESH